MLKEIRHSKKKANLATSETLQLQKINEIQQWKSYEQLTMKTGVMKHERNI